MKGSSTKFDKRASITMNATNNNASIKGRHAITLALERSTKQGH